MLKTTRRTVVAGAVLVALGLATEAAAQEAVKIGVIYPLSGNSASAGNYSKMAIEVGADVINNGNAELAKIMPLAKGGGLPGLKGAKIQLIFADNQGTPAAGQNQALRLISEERLTTLFLVPTMFHDVLRHPEFESYDLRSLSRVGFAGMTMSQALIECCLDQLKPDLFVNYYGSSEIYTFSYCDHLDRKPGCAGRAGMNQIIRVVSPSGDDDIEIDLPSGVTGEIVASMRSPEAFSRYWKRPDADAKAIQGRWYRTGDLGRFDEDGELYVVGRVDDMIISGGENIFPEEVEDALARSKLVAGCAVVGMPDERLGAKVVAFVEPASAELAPDELDKVCLRSGLARFKRPREYVFVKAIPRSASGKLLRRKLRTGEYEAFADNKVTVKEDS